MRSYSQISNYGARKKQHRGLKIFLGVMIALLAVGCIAFALNYNTVMLLLGKGKIDVPSTSSLASSLHSNGQYQGVQVSTDSSGDTIVTAQSKDGAVSLKSVTDPSHEQKISIQVDVSKMSGVSSEKSLSNVQTIIQKVNSYLKSVIDPTQLTGVEGYVTKSVISQYKSGGKTFSVSHNFDGTTLQMTGNFETKVIEAFINGKSDK